MKVYRRPTNKSTAKPFTHQDWFSDFNWQACERGDIIWLEDHPGNDTCGIFLSANENAVVIQAIRPKDAKIIIRLEVENINRFASERYWQGLIS